MKKKTFIFSLLLSAILLAGCGKNAELNATILSEEEAKQIALEQVSGATAENLYKFQKDTDDAIVKYEGEIHYDGKEYEFEIHAYDGTILKWDEEPLNEKFD